MRVTEEVDQPRSSESEPQAVCRVPVDVIQTPERDSLARAASSQDDQPEAKIEKPASFAGSVADCKPGPACPRAYTTLECPWNTIFTLWRVAWLQAALAPSR